MSDDSSAVLPDRKFLHYLQCRCSSTAPGGGGAANTWLLQSEHYYTDVNMYFTLVRRDVDYQSLSSVCVVINGHKLSEWWRSKAET
jgi:hypothetical protein